MQQLLRLAPATALLLTTDPDGHVNAEEEVPISLVQRGDLLKVADLPAACTQMRSHKRICLVFRAGTHKPCACGRPLLGHRGWSLRKS